MVHKRLIWLVLLLVVHLPIWGATTGFQEISFEELKDKLRGGWAGQMIGVSYGAPTEFRYRGRIIPEAKMPKWSPDRIHNSIRQDDLYVEMTFAQVLDEKGLNATTQDFGDMFRHAKYRLWHANLAARRALKRGVPADKSGTPEYNAHANDIDFQIEADFIGLMSPGLPVASNDLCWRVGRVMNSGDGIYGGMFVSGMYAAAFFEKDVRAVVKAGLACLPSESPYAKVISDVLKWSAENPDSWVTTWQLLEDKWNDRDPCPAGALLPFNIDAKLNGAYIALGMLYGRGDFWRTLEVSTRAGQDSDCNPSNAAGVLGVMIGYEQIPSRLTEGIVDIENEKFSYTNYSFNSIIDSNLKWIIQMVENNGGRVEADKLLVKVQTPEPAALEIWDDYGSPVERIGVDDPRWKWMGDWEKISNDTRAGKVASVRGSRAGCETRIEFEGTGAILVGPYLTDGGIADVYLDGRLHRTVDVYSDEERDKGHEAVWHAFGLDLKSHELRIVVRGQPFGESKGPNVEVLDLVVFR
jgi:hypothetical protein